MNEKDTKQISRRRFIAGAATIGGAAALAACAPATPAPAPTATPVPAQATATPVPAVPTDTPVPAPTDTPEPVSPVTRGGTLRHIDWLAIDNLDPHLSNTRDTAWMPQLYDTLLSYKLVNPETEEFELTPALAESYEVTDPTTLVFHLRQGVTFHDGSEFTAEVAKWNLERATDHPDSKVASTMAGVEGITALDKHTLQVKFDAPAPMFPLQMSPANPVTVFMVSQEAVEKQGDTDFGSKPVGSGPFKFREWLRDDRLTLDRFEDHWEMGEDGRPLPYADSYVDRLITDQSVAMVEMRTGNSDIFLQMLLQDVDMVQSEPDLMVYSIPGRWVGYPSLYFNQNPVPELGDLPFTMSKELRYAAQYATDRQALADTLGFGMAFPHYYWDFYPGVPGYDESLPRREFDLDKAIALVKEAGYPDGVDVEVKVINRPSDVQPLEILQAMWAKAGIRLQINLLDRLVWIDDGRAGNWDALSHSNTALVDPALRQNTRSGSTYNWAAYSSDVMDGLWEQALQEYDVAKRIQIYAEMQKLMYEEAYHFVGFRQPSVGTVNKRVQGVSTKYNHRYIWLQS